jgi:ketosteroid isomerase-like protein
MRVSKKGSTLLILTILLVSIISGCNEKVEENAEVATVAVVTFDLATAKSEIKAANNNFKAFFAAVDSVGLSNLYTQDTKFMMNGAPAISGRENVLTTFSGIMSSGITGADLRTLEVWGTDEYITEEGEYSLFAGDAEADHGKYLVLWKNVNGEWKLHRDIFNTDVSAE